MKTMAAILPGFVLAAVCAAWPMRAADAVVLQIKADQVTAKVSPMLYGYMTEEINYSYDGGLYAELVRNRAFKEERFLSEKCNHRSTGSGNRAQQ
jgi:alpha-N-arabinofuranosidase